MNKFQKNKASQNKSFQKAIFCLFVSAFGIFSFNLVSAARDFKIQEEATGIPLFFIEGDTGYVGIGTDAPDTLLTLTNNSWISAKNADGTGYVNMFKVNASNEIEVGGTLNIGTIGLVTDSGAVNLVNMPVSATPVQGTEESYSFSLDSEVLLKVYSEADGTGGIQNKRIGINTVSPQKSLDVTGDAEISNQVTAGSAYVTNDVDVVTGNLLVQTGNVGIGMTIPPGAKLAIDGGLHVGGVSDPGDNNLLVDGDVNVIGTLNAGTYSMNNIAASIYYDKDNTNYYLDPAGDVMPSSLKIAQEIEMQQDHYINRRFEMIENANPQYILLVVNGANNDVNGRITMDRTSGNYQSSIVDVIVSSGTSAMYGGALKTLQVLQNGERYQLVTVDYGGVNYVAIKYTGNSYPETTGAYFTGRIKSTGSNVLAVVDSSVISNESSFGGSSKADFDVDNIRVNNNIVWHADNDGSNSGLDADLLDGYDWTTVPDGTDKWVDEAGDTMTGPLTMSGSSANIILGSNYLSGDGGDEGVFVDSAGNVGIGSANPVAKLDVEGQIRVGAYGLQANAVPRSYIDDSFVPIAGGESGTGAGFVQGGNSFGALATLGTNDNFDLTFETNNTRRMTIDTAGKVGIGTITPSYQLTVTEDFGFDDGSMYIEDVAGSTSIYSDNYYSVNALNYLKPAETGTALDVAGIIQVKGSGNNYFAGNIELAATKKALLGPSLSSGNLNMITESQLPSGLDSGRGWVIYGGTGSVEEVDFIDGKKVRAIKLVSSENSYIYTPRVKVDPNKTYKFSVWVKTDSPGTGSRYFGLYAYNSANSQIGVLGSDGTENTNPYFWNGDPNQNKWTYFETYLYPTGSANAPNGWRMDEEGNYSGGIASYKWKADTEDALIRLLNYYNSGTTITDYFYMPRIVEVGEGQSITDSRYQMGDAYITGSLSADNGDVTTDGVGNVAAESYYDGAYYLDPDLAATSLNVAGVVQANGAGNNYFAGKVGIGTASPGARLHVVDTSSSGESIRAQYNDGHYVSLGFDGGWPAIKTNGSVLRIMDRMEIWGRSGARYFDVRDDGGNQNVKINGMGDSFLAATNGNVGIGTTNPGAKLDIDGAVRIKGTNKLHFDTTGTEFSNYIWTTNDYWLSLENNRGSAARIDIATNDIRFGFDSDVGQMILKANGNVGIGTTGPDSKLHIDDGLVSVRKSADGTYRTPTEPYQLTPKGYVDDAIAVGDVEHASTADYATSAGSADHATYANSALRAQYLGDSFQVMADAQGNVGIGTTSPEASPSVLTTMDTIIQIGDNSNAPELRLAGPNSAGVSSKIVFDNSASGQGMSVFFASDTSPYGQDGLVFWDENGGNAQMKINRDNGYVGIGTSDPQYSLDIRDSSVAEIHLPDSYWATGTDDFAATIGYVHENFAPITGGVGSAFVQGGNSFGELATLGTNDNYDLTFETNNTRRMTIDTEGKVGIGTTSPDYTLHTYTPTAAGSAYLQIDRQADTEVVGLVLATAGTPDWYNYVTADADRSLIWNDGVTDLMTLTNDGYLGIGPDYTSPNALLDVNNKFLVSDTQVTINVPLNLASAGDISFASDLIFTNPTASYIKSQAPLYIEAGDPAQNVDLTLRASNAGEVVVDDVLRVVNNAYLDGGANLSGPLNMDGQDITGVDKLTVSTIDPIHKINNKEYATFVSFYAGGQKMETSGVINLEIGERDYSYVIDFEKLEEGSDLWLFWKTIHQDLEKLTIILTPGFNGRAWYQKIGNNKIIIFGDQLGEVSYTLVAPRYDYKKWPNLISKNQ